MLVLALTMLMFGDAQPVVDCAYDQKALMAEDIHAFDQTMHSGWRTLADKGCMTQAADLIKAWRARHGDLPADLAANVAWHEGQMRAAAGDDSGAITAFSASLSHPDPTFRDYAAATIAFLKRDHAALLAARAALVAEPKPEGWDAAAADYKAHYGETATWPDNLDKVDALIACYDQPYKTAYGCRPKT